MRAIRIRTLCASSSTFTYPPVRYNSGVFARSMVTNPGPIFTASPFASGIVQHPCAAPAKQAHGAPPSKAPAASTPRRVMIFMEAPAYQTSLSDSSAV